MLFLKYVASLPYKTKISLCFNVLFSKGTDTVLKSETLLFKSSILKSILNEIFGCKPSLEFELTTLIFSSLPFNFIDSSNDSIDIL